jgi:HAD superfamily hydrolase (TIGR01509 family)
MPEPFLPVPRALLIDAGFTLVSYDGLTIAQLASAAGVEVTGAEIEATEAILRAELAHHEWPQRPDSAAPVTGGARFFRRVLELSRARTMTGTLDAASEAIWKHHLVENLWSRPLEGVVAALEQLRSLGLRLAIVSNSEGTVEALLERMGLKGHFEAVVDSWHLGVTKPDPAIFHHALERLKVDPADAVMVGDSMKADVGGAIAAGMRGVLIDPFDLHADVQVPRYPSFAAFTEALVLGQKRAGSS